MSRPDMIWWDSNPTGGINQSMLEEQNLRRKKTKYLPVRDVISLITVSLTP